MDQEHRKHERQGVSLAGVLKVADGSGGNPGAAHNCTIEDLSVGGARVRLTAAAGAPAIANGQLEIESFGAYPVTVAWSRPPLLGLKFQDSPETMAEILAAIAMHG